jgi:hypothetical protein
MTLANCPAPTAAERIRSTCVRAGAALLAVDGAEPLTTPLHHLLGDGSFAVTVPVGGAVAAQLVDGGRQAMLEFADFAPLPLREPVRSLVWIRGRLHQVPLPAVGGTLDRIAAEDANPVLLQVQTPRSAPVTDQTADDTRYLLARLEIESVVAADSTGAEAVDVRTLLAARPDPFCAFESCWIRHLDTAHLDVVARLAARLPARLRRGDVHPLGVDRYGVRLRVETADGDHDVRLPFREPVDDVTGLGQAIRLLMGCPFVNGLRARRD